MTLSPFKYPGSKHLAAKRIVKFLDNDKIVDVFVGGGAVMLAALERGRCCVVNDKDPDVSAFWQVVFGDPKVLAVMAGRLDFRLTPQAFKSLQKSKPTGLVDKAIKSIVLNHTSWNGIKTGGYSKEQVKRDNSRKIIPGILFIGKTYRNDVKVLPPLDFEDVLKRNDDGALYIDPPYYDKGDQVYEEKMTHDDHVRLAGLLYKEERLWLLSYDNHDTIKELYEDYHQKELNWTYHGTHEEGNELLVSNKDLKSWGKM